MQPSTISLLCATAPAATLLLWLIYMKWCERIADAEFDAEATALFNRTPARRNQPVFTFDDVYSDIQARGQK